MKSWDGIPGLVEVTVLRLRNQILLAVLFLCAVCGVSQQPGSPPNAAIHGWLSDEQCARGRATSGMFSGTNPRCARECVAKGRKIVLIDPERKTIFAIDNPALAKKNVGDYVEIKGQTNLQAKTIRIESLKMLSAGVASCERAKLEK